MRKARPGRNYPHRPIYFIAAADLRFVHAVALLFLLTQRLQRLSPGPRASSRPSVCPIDYTVMPSRRRLGRVCSATMLAHPSDQRLPSLQLLPSPLPFLLYFQRSPIFRERSAFQYFILFGQRRSRAEYICIFSSSMTLLSDALILLLLKGE